MTIRQHARLVVIATLALGTLCLAWGHYRWPAAWFVRGYLGDVIAMIFVVAMLRWTFGNWMAVRTATVIAILVAVVIESLQLVIHASGVLGTALGTHFDWFDLLAYTVGAALAFFYFVIATPDSLGKIIK
jgi:glycopeptide antibiotics resistance protein